MNRSTSKAFTLTELLVVIGVLLIVALLGLPVILGQAEKGRSAACVVKLRNLAVVMTQFRTERNQQLWNLRPVADGGEGSFTPAQALYRYGLIRSARELCCPSATTSNKGAWQTGGSGSPDYMRDIATEWASYAVNGMAFYQFSPWRTSTTVTHYPYYLGHESRMPLFMDGKAFQLNLTSWQPALRMSRVALRHGERCHVLFMDGHVEALDRHAMERLDPNGGKNPAWLKDFGVAD